MTCLNCHCRDCEKARSERPKERPKPWRKYPWNEWFDGAVRTLIRGEHYQCSTQRMRLNVYEMAARKGFRAHAYVSGDTVKVWVDGRRRIPFRCLTVEQQRKLAAGCEAAE